MGCFSSKGVVGVIAPQNDFFDKYEMAEVLGRGAYGTVHLAYSFESNEKLAVKVLESHNRKAHSIVPRADQSHQDLGDEHAAWVCIGRHPNVVALRESFVGRRFTYFVMEYCAGSLFTAWKTEPHLNEYTYVPYFKDMARALAHIHSVGVVHRDVKQDNFMVGAPDGRTVKLCDFGLSAVLSGDQKLSGEFGTPPYLAPEMLDRSGVYGPPADVWSFGVIVYTAFFGCWPYQPRVHNAEEMKKAIRDDTVRPSFAPPARFPQNVVSEPGIRFVKALLDRNPFSRPSAPSCLEMAYFDTRRWNQMQVNGRIARAISLSAQLYAAKKCGAFTVRTPRADALQERYLMNLQYAAQLRRESCRLRPDATKVPTTVAPDVAGASPMPNQPLCIAAEEATKVQSQSDAQATPRPAAPPPALLAAAKIHEF